MQNRELEINELERERDFYYLFPPAPLWRIREIEERLEQTNGGQKDE